ncbi:hypothetical protein INP83_08940 [Mucilaginibacter sp. 21P]|uniref:hypothetical protein n=1 Tax=Mucilaginibacter sp. 21P TaxID=2778902 RepID=UPI001C58EB61|nr:hypothetical protein [Mucilaginibacter sp. 21P]QXV67193.1 hypothetical protein INP83_08940 [Mucilaginibacter sp. 21P]
MKKAILLCSVMFMFCFAVKAQTNFANAQAKESVASSINAKPDVNAVKPIMYNLTVQNNTGGGTFQFQLVPQFSGGTNASFNFTTSQTISVVGGVYSVYLRGPGSTYRFAYQICATFGSITGQYATFNNVNICSDNGVISVN